MPTKKASVTKIIFRNFFRRIEQSISLLKERITKRQFIYLAAVLIAITSGFAVIVLKYFAHQVFLFATYVNTYLKLPYINSILPIVGILLTVFVVKHFLGGELEKGSSKILYAIAKKGGFINKKQMYAQIMTSSLTVGLGGSAGLESPIVITGAAFGSNFAQKYHLTQKERVLLLACGVAAGISAAFNAPIAGVLFAIEVVLVDVAISAFIPIMISAATGALVSTIVLKEDVLLYFKQDEHYDYHNIVYYIILGVLAGFASVMYARHFRAVEGFFHRKKMKVYNKALLGSAILALLIFLSPTLFGEGYESIKTLTSSNPNVLLENTLFDKHKGNEWVLLLFVGATVLLKAVASGLTIGAGGNGGNFAPSLFMGSYLGFFVAKFFILTGINPNMPVANFTVVGMAGILSGLFHAPLTAIFLIGEITGGYDLMVPLMIVSSISYAVSKRFESHSIDVKGLAAKDEAYTSDKDRNVLLNIDVNKIITTDYSTLTITQSLDKVVEIFSTSNQKIIPILDEKNTLLGIVEYDNVKTYIFNPYRIKFTPIEEVMTAPKALINVEDGMIDILKCFDKTKAKELPIMKHGVYYGCLTKLKILEKYRIKSKELVIE
ncbi:chloride channel protein [Flavobacterium sp.]